MRRRTALSILGISLLATATRAQSRLYRIGVLGTVAGIMVDQVKAELGRLGYVEGRNSTWIIRLVNGGVDELREAARALAREKADVILALGTSATLAAKSVTTQIPIVGVSITDPEGLGVVDKLAKPLANVTGIGNRGEELGAKRIEVLRSIAPVKRMGWLLNAGSVGNLRALERARDTARSLGVSIVELPVREPADVPTALASARRQAVDSILVPLDAMLDSNRERVASFALDNRIASIGAQRSFVEAGGLASYGQNQIEIAKLAAAYADRLLKGAQVQNLPFQRADKVELGLNLKTARALSFSIPKEMLARADYVIE